jgi:hypothetical protein
MEPMGALKTNAIPVSAGSCRRSAVIASKPPADAPTPTTGNSSSAFASSPGSRLDGAASETCLSEAIAATSRSHYRGFPGRSRDRFSTVLAITNIPVQKSDFGVPAPWCGARRR